MHVGDAVEAHVDSVFSFTAGEMAITKTDPIHDHARRWHVRIEPYHLAAGMALRIGTDSRHREMARPMNLV